MASTASHHHDLDDEAVLGPEESLELLHAEQARAARSFDVDARLLYVAWGLAWLVGYAAFALSGGGSGDSPPALPSAVLFLGVLVALTVTAVHTTRRQRGLAGPSVVTGSLYGIAWPIAFVALSLLVYSVGAALEDARVHAVLWPAGTGLVVGLLYLMGGALWRDRTQYALGTWVALTSCAAPFLGLPGQYWVMALAGGGGFLAAAAVEDRRRGASTGTSV